MRDSWSSFLLFQYIDYIEVEHTKEILFSLQNANIIGDRTSCGLEDLVNSDDIYLPSLFLVDQQEAVVSHPYNHHVRWRRNRERERRGTKTKLLSFEDECCRIDENKADEEETNDGTEKISAKRRGEEERRERFLFAIFIGIVWFFFLLCSR